MGKPKVTHTRAGYRNVAEELGIMSRRLTTIMTALEDAPDPCSRNAAEAAAEALEKARHALDVAAGAIHF